MKDVMGVIYTSKNDLRLRELTMSRAVAALPVLGRYRIIDFTLSNLVNSGIRNVGVIMQRNYHSLMDHLGAGKEWDLHTRNDGLIILPPYLTRENVGAYGGIVDALRSNVSYLRRSQQEYVVLTNSHTVLNTSFYEMVREHQENDADITMMYVKSMVEDYPADAQLDRRVYLGMDDNGQVTDLEVGPTQPSYDNLYLDVLLIKRDLLIHLVDQAVAHGTNDFNRDILLRNIQGKVLRIMGYEYKGYCRRIDSVLSYYRLNMDMLNASLRHQMFAANPVYTKVRDMVPARYGADSTARNSLVADGCLVDGYVENSVLFRGVHVGKGARVVGSIVMQGSDIQDGAEVENMILDKNVTIKAGGRLVGRPNYPILIGKGYTI